MKVLREKVRKMAKAELVMANEEFPLFASDHEGLAVIEEEVMEAEHDMDAVEYVFEELKRTVFHDYPYSNRRENVDQLELLAIELACEAIQVAAMCQKYRMSHKEVKE